MAHEDCHCSFIRSSELEKDDLERYKVLLLQREYNKDIVTEIAEKDV